MTETLSFNQFWDSELREISPFEKEDFFAELADNYGIDTKDQQVELNILRKTQKDFLEYLELLAYC